MKVIGRRRVVIAGIAALATSSRAARQAPLRKPVLIGYLTSTRPDKAEVQALIDAFRSEMQRLGCAEGTQVVYESRYADGVVEHFPMLARELVSLKVDHVFAISSGAVDALKAATQPSPRSNAWRTSGSFTRG